MEKNEKDDNEKYNAAKRLIMSTFVDCILYCIVDFVFSQLVGIYIFESPVVKILEFYPSFFRYRPSGHICFEM